MTRNQYKAKRTGKWLKTAFMALKYMYELPNPCRTVSINGGRPFTKAELRKVVDWNRNRLMFLLS